MWPAQQGDGHGSSRWTACNSLQAVIAPICSRREVKSALQEGCLCFQAQLLLLGTLEETWQRVALLHQQCRLLPLRLSSKLAVTLQSLDPFNLNTHRTPVQQACGEFFKVDVAIFVKVDAPHQALNLLLADIIALEQENHHQVLDNM